MHRPTRQTHPVALLGLLALAGCSTTSGPPAAPAPAAPAATSVARIEVAPPDSTFMTDMIAHHAQAVRIAGWAPTHGASPAVQRMAERVVVGQNDEIAIIQRWLRTRGQPVPEPDSMHAMMPGMDHMMHMPGMLSAEQMAQLDAARGPEFNRLFLTLMIRHHQGALTMVDRLFGSQGAAQDETVFRLASDIYADQSTEIDRMQKMLATLPGEGSSQ